MAINNLGHYAHPKGGLKPNTTAPAQARTSFAGPGETFPDGDENHARLAIPAASRSEHAGNITPAEEATIQANARGKLRSYKVGPTKGPIAEVRKHVVDHPDVHPTAKRLIIAEIAKVAANGNTHAQVDAHGTENGEHHILVKPRPDLSSTPGGRFGYSPNKPPMAGPPMPGASGMPIGS